jgi:AraC-like DNA-binding protein
MRTDAIEEHYTRGFDGVFVIGGSEGTMVPDPSIIGPLRKLFSNARVVKWNAQGWRLVEATGYRIDSSEGEASTSKSINSFDPSRSDLRFAGRNISGPLAAALSFIPRDVGIEIARRITAHVTSPEVDLRGVEIHQSDEIDTTHRVRKAGQWLRENCKQSISVRQVAEVAGMSERNFLRRFKIETGMTPSEYLLNARLEMTCHLLETTTLPADKIARRCGLGSGVRLSRIFRRRLCLTPGEYRAAHHSYAASSKT